MESESDQTTCKQLNIKFKNNSFKHKFEIILLKNFINFINNIIIFITQNIKYKYHVKFFKILIL